MNAMSIDEQRQKHDEIVRNICELNEEEFQEMKKDNPDLMTLYQISAERADREEEICNI